MKLHSELAQGLYLVEKSIHRDERGEFERLFCIEELEPFWGNRRVVQSNRSITRKVGSFRGFHYQKPPYAEMKVVRCTHGRVRDYAIDLRANSKTFLQTFSYDLSANQNLCAIIPEGFAHGFQVLEPDSELVYFHSAPYMKAFEDGINYQDPLFNIVLPLPIQDLSRRDQDFKFKDKTFQGVLL